MADGDPLVFTEKTGALREVRLGGSALPEQGLREASSLRTMKNNYPGTEEASTQVLGTVEDDIPLSGWLKDVHMGIGRAQQVKRQLKAIQKGQRLCSMQWGSELDVLGFLKSVAFETFHTADLRYDLVFEVQGTAEAEIIAVTIEPEVSEADVVLDLDGLDPELDAAADFVASLEDVGAIL